MSEIEYALLGAICVFAFLLRLVPIIVKKEYGYDSYYHILVARALRKERTLSRKDDFMVPEGAYTYPPLLHMILWPFSGKGERAALAILSPLIDTITVAIAFFFVQSLGVWQPLLAALIVAVSPQSVLQACSLNPRPLGNLFLVMALLSSFWFWDSENLMYFGLAILFSALVMLSHKMSLQALIAAQLAVSVAATVDSLANGFHGILLFLVIPAAIGVAGALSLGHYVRVVLPDHIKFVKVHLRHGDYLSAEKRFPSPIQLLKNDLLPYLAPFLGAYVLLELDAGEVITFLFAWALGVMMIAQTWRWGDAWRYLQFGTFPSAMLVAAWLWTAGYDTLIEALIIAAIVLVLLLITALQLRRTIKGDPTSTILEALRRLPPEWKAKLDGVLVYSNIIHPTIPYAIGAKCLGVNPTSSGIEVSFQFRELGHKSLSAMSSYAKKAIGKPLDYFLVFRTGPQPATDNFERVYLSDDLSIFIEKP